MSLIGHYRPTRSLFFFNHLHTFHLSYHHDHSHVLTIWYDNNEMETWTFIVQRSDDDVAEVNSEWDYLTGLHGNLPTRTYIPVSPGPCPYSTCWPCDLILPLKSEVIAPDDTPIVTSIEWMNCDLWKGLYKEPGTTHPGWSQSLMTLVGFEVSNQWPPSPSTAVLTTTLLGRVCNKSHNLSCSSLGAGITSPPPLKVWVH